MFPTSSISNSVDGVSGYPCSFGDCVSRSPIGQFLSYVEYLTFGKVSFWVTFSMRASTLKQTIFLIINVSTYPKMLWVSTLGVITGMAYKQWCRWQTTIMEKITNSVGILLRSTAKYTIPFFTKHTKPSPTGIRVRRFLNETPEVINLLLSKLHRVFILQNLELVKWGVS